MPINVYQGNETKQAAPAQHARELHQPQNAGEVALTEQKRNHDMIMLETEAKNRILRS